MRTFYSLHRKYEHQARMFTVEELNNQFDFIDWKVYFQSVMSEPRFPGGRDKFIVASPQYLQQASAIISALLATEAGAEVVENFLKWRILESLVPVLTLPFRQARADLVNKLSGMETRLAMWSGSDRYLFICLSGKYLFICR